MTYILKNTIKIISNYCKLEKQTKRRFQTKLRLENCLLWQKLQERFLLKLTKAKDLCNSNSDLCH